MGQFRKQRTVMKKAMNYISNRTSCVKFVLWKPSSINYDTIALSGRRARLYTFPLFAFPLTNCPRFRMFKRACYERRTADAFPGLGRSYSWADAHRGICPRAQSDTGVGTILLLVFLQKKKLSKFRALSSHFERRSMLPKAASMTIVTWRNWDGKTAFVIGLSDKS